MLEARDRIGGRVWTVRGGDRIVQTGRPDQLCEFSEGLYLNAGRGADPAPSSRHPRLCETVRRGDGDHGQFQPRRPLGIQRPGLHQPPAHLRRARPLHRAARQGDRQAARSTGSSPAATRMRCASSSTSTAASARAAPMFRTGGPATIRCRAAIARPGGRSARSASKRCSRSARGSACLWSSRSFSTCRRRCSSRSAAWTGSRMRSTSRCGRSCASTARSPPSAAAAKACASSTARAARRSTRTFASARCR